MDIASEYELDLDLRRRERRFAIDLLLLSLQCVLRRRERLRCLKARVWLRCKQAGKLAGKEVRRILEIRK